MPKRKRRQFGVAFEFVVGRAQIPWQTLQSSHKAPDIYFLAKCIETEYSSWCIVSHAAVAPGRSDFVAVETDRLVSR
jgi:hypothetical protein